MSKKEDSSQTWPTGPIVSLPAPFEDSRGVIQTLVDGGIQSVQVITSKATTVRANHYHKTDSHFMYVIKGVMKYFHRPALDKLLIDHFTGRHNHEKLLWCLLNLELWHREYAID